MTSRSQNTPEGKKGKTSPSYRKYSRLCGAGRRVSRLFLLCLVSFPVASSKPHKALNKEDRGKAGRPGRRPSKFTGQTGLCSHLSVVSVLPALWLQTELTEDWGGGAASSGAVSPGIRQGRVRGILELWGVRVNPDWGRGLGTGPQS